MKHLTLSLLGTLVLVACGEKPNTPDQPPAQHQDQGGPKDSDPKPKDPTITGEETIISGLFINKEGINAPLKNLSPDFTPAQEVGTLSNGIITLKLNPQKLGLKQISEVYKDCRELLGIALPQDVLHYKINPLTYDEGEAKKELAIVSTNLNDRNIQLETEFWYVSKNTKLKGSMACSDSTKSTMYELDLKEGWNVVDREYKLTADKKEREYEKYIMSKTPTGPFSWIVVNNH